MLRDSRSRHVERLAEHSNRAPAARQALEYRPPRGIGQRPEHRAKRIGRVFRHGSSQAPTTCEA